ncbi:NAD(P)-dependent oxidoreductase [Thermoflavimicrobium daqui]|uniref:NAD(P)-binding domain-containing protein n=1 Tax=Thermoflavimicrobium daqui TaxID=2137476 RepID=A0A364K410_9BACL|nr:SDR family oxidoreductase [Thermoflavimicrobium daqui]RAL24114.1 hypothetical protein DL897_10505 [Thermoflavimicrobium daqui]
MHLLLLGATGRVGNLVLRKALQDGHQVTVLVRNPDRLNINDSNLTVYQGNVRNKNDLKAVMKGKDVVLSALSTDGTTTLSDSIPFIIEAMEEEKVKRIITIGTAGILQSRSEPNLLRYQSSESKRKLTRAAGEHHQVFIKLAQSNLDWTIICPTYLPDGEEMGHYRVERNFLPEGGASISVSDTASFMYQQITSDQYVGVRVGIAY